MLTHDGIEQSDLPYLRECIERGEMINKVFALDLLSTLQETFDELARVRRVAVEGLEAAKVGPEKITWQGSYAIGMVGLSIDRHNTAIDAAIDEIKAGEQS